MKILAIQNSFHFRIRDKANWENNLMLEVEPICVKYGFRKEMIEEIKLDFLTLQMKEKIAVQ